MILSIYAGFIIYGSVFFNNVINYFTLTFANLKYIGLYKNKQMIYILWTGKII